MQQNSKDEGLQTNIFSSHKCPIDKEQTAKDKFIA